MESRISFNFCAGVRGLHFLVVLGVSVFNVGLQGVSMLDDSSSVQFFYLSYQSYLLIKPHVRYISCVISADGNRWDPLTTPLLSWGRHILGQLLETNEQ